MKDHRFIELLNLYIDRQITAEETAELEAEIQRHPKRQAVYRQYCQIHTATKLVYESFRTGPEEQAAPSGRPASIELFENRRRTNWAYYAGGLAAAACLGLVVMRYNAADEAARESFVANSRPAPTTVVATVQTVAAPVANPAKVETAATPNFVGLRNPNTNPDYAAMLAALREQDEERALSSNDRWQPARVQSLFDDNMFETKRVLVAPDPRPMRARPTSGQAESTAFQFQR